MLKLLAISVALSACVDQGPLDPSGDEVSSEELGLELVRPSDVPPPLAGDVCDNLPEDDTACSVACDHAALLTYIPPGTCATFVCTLTDGGQIRAGGCRPPLPTFPVSAFQREGALAQ